jgi:hypothetical protein
MQLADLAGFGLRNDTVASTMLRSQINTTVSFRMKVVTGAKMRLLDLGVRPLPHRPTSWTMPMTTCNSHRRTHGNARRALHKVCGIVVAACVMLLLCIGGATAQTTACPNADHTTDYNCPLGPIYAIPNWVDTSGWMDPSQYTTIQAGLVGGVLPPPNAPRRLIARGSGGLEVWERAIPHLVHFGARRKTAQKRPFFGGPPNVHFT